MDGSPGVRLVWLFGAMLLPMLAVVGRLTYLQCVLADEYARGFEVHSESFEPLPSRDGRILSADGRVLACDIEQFDLLVHYRWLQEPPDEAWLKQQALSRLGRSDRRNPELVKAERQKVLERREAMWERLGQLNASNVREGQWADAPRSPGGDLAARRAAIQRRVERIIASVERRRDDRDRAAQQRSGKPIPEDAPWWHVAWHAVSVALTTPPERLARERLVVQEELDYHLLIEDVGLPVAAEIETHPELYPGLQVRVSTSRAYPGRTLAAHIVGSRLPIDAEELEARRRRFPQGDPLDYRERDRIGKSGVERSWDRQLRGLRGVRKTVRNRQGEVVSVETVRGPRVGSDVVLTLHLTLQQRLEELLDRTLGLPAVPQADIDDEDEPAPIDGPLVTTRSPTAGGCIIALDVHTGAVLAAASAPRFDLDLLVNFDSDVWRRTLDDPRRPFFHRATQMTLPPGSVFKTLSAVALLESGQIDPDLKFHCQGYLDRPNRNRCYIFSHYGVGHGETDLSDALCKSCNVWFFAAARKTGPQPLVEWAERFGFGRPTGIDLPGEQGGNLPRPPAAERGRVPWYPGDTLGLAIGQSRLTVTPMQIARLMAVVANDGDLVTPHVVRGPGPAMQGAALTPRREVRRVAGLSDGTLERVREGLARVVADRQGTGYKTVHLKEVAIAGKTGTAEVGGGRPDHAWFAGYVPADRPRVAFVVVLEHAGSGGRAAGPVAKQLVQTLLELELLP